MFERGGDQHLEPLKKPLHKGGLKRLRPLNCWYGVQCRRIIQRSPVQCQRPSGLTRLLSSRKETWRETAVSDAEKTGHSGKEAAKQRVCLLPRLQQIQPPGQAPPALASNDGWRLGVQNFGFASSAPLPRVAMDTNHTLFSSSFHHPEALPASARKMPSALLCAALLCRN